MRRAWIARMVWLAVATMVMAVVCAGAEQVRAAAARAVARQDSGQKDEAKTDKDKEKKEEKLPLQTARKINFTTDEGTWMSLDVSPDGREIVFDLLGDLYVVPIEGGEAKAITTGLPWDCEPRFSPDGKQIAFISDRNGSDNIWLINADGGNPKQVTKETDDLVGSPSWTPDGQYIVARKWGPYPGPQDYLRSQALWLYHKDGGKGIEVVKGQGATTINSGAYFSPDGKLLYFSSHPDTFKYNVDIGRFQVHTFNRETGEIQTITAEYGGGLRPLPSPDGRYLVYASRHDAKTGLRIRDLKTRDEHWLTMPMQRDDQEGFAVNDVLPGYAFTPDSKSVIFTGDGHIKRVDIATHTVTAIPFHANVNLDLGPRVHTDYVIDDGPLTLRQMRWTHASPDGKQLVFSAAGRIWLYDMASGKAHRLTDGKIREYSPAFSPDGKWIAYTTWSDVEGGELWKAPADGGAAVKLSPITAYYAMPAWSPDGSKILFVLGSARGWLSEDGGDVNEIRWISSDGGDMHLVVAYPDGYQAPTFNADGTRVYYMDDAPPPPGATGPGKPARLLRSIRLDGLDKKAHMRLEGDFVMAIPSPDEQYVAIQDRYDAYLTVFPKVGTEPVSVDMKGGTVPVKRITTTGANYIHWADGGKTITWSFANEYSRVSRDAVFQAEKPNQWKPETVSIALQAPREIPQGKLFLRGARVVTMKGEEILDRGDILVENNRIKQVAKSGTVAVPAGAKLIDLRGKTILPGFVDIHSHMHSGRDEQTDQEWSYAANLAFGVTTTRDPSIESNTVFAQSELVSAGDMVGPRIYATGTAITTNAASIGSLEDAENIVKRYKAHGADSLKQYMQPRRIQREWLGMAAAKEGMNITAEGGGDLKTDLSMVLDGYTGVEHSLPVVPIYKDIIQLEAQAGTTYTPTLIVSYGGEFGQYYWRAKMNIHDDPKVMRFTPHEQVDSVARRRALLLDDEYIFPLIAKGVGDVMKAGGHVALGSHGEQQGIGAHWEIWMMQSGGMTPWQTLYSATMNGAESIGLEKQLGSIEPGKLADLVVYNSNPVENIRNTTDILYVIKNGVVYQGDTLDEVWPTEKKFPQFFWKKSDGELTTLPK